jgi:hypothetical protein
MWTRGNTFRVLFLVALLVVPLWIEWGEDGPTPDRAFWIIFDYFLEIAIWGAVEVRLAIAWPADEQDGPTGPTIEPN